MDSEDPPASENRLRLRIQELEEALEALQSGRADALMSPTSAGRQVLFMAGAADPYRAIVDQMSEAAGTATWDASILYGNDRFLEMTGIPSEKIVGCSLKELMPLAGQVALASALETRSSARMDVMICPVVGPPVPVYLALRPLNLAGVDGFTFVATDVSAKGLYEQEILRNQKLESVGVLAAGIAHDFNNILTAIVGNLTLAKTETDPAELKDLLAEAEGAAMRARGLTQQLLTFAKGGAPVKALVELPKVVREAVSLALSGSQIKAQFQIDGDLYACDADEGQISQVFNNLALNAVQAMPTGGVLIARADNVTVTSETPVAALKPGLYVRVEFHDSGIGIAPGNLAKIFDPYFTTKSMGSGLGLAVCFAVIQKHGGHISVVSEIGEGTTFTILLPATERRPVTAVPLQETGLFAGRVLVMDDEDSIRRVTTRILSNYGFDVTTVAEGASAVALYREALEAGHPFAVVILDLTVAGAMGGAEAFRAIRALHPEARGIVSSGYSEDPIMSGYRSFGFVAALSKPCTADVLARTVSGAMHMSAADLKASGSAV